MDKEIALLDEENIKNKIHTIRGLKVMVDTDLAVLYEVPTKVLNQAVKRNIERFPDSFMFQLTNDEFKILRSQIVTLEAEQDLMFQTGTSTDDSLRFHNDTLKKGHGKHRKYLPYMFTEQGVAMLSSVLRSDIAVKVSIQIMNAFVSMRRFIASNTEIFVRLDNVERKQLDYQIKTDDKFEKVFDAIEDKSIIKTQGIFFNGQIFDAYKFISDLIRNAKESIVLIDNYVDDTVLTLFSKREKDVEVIIYTKDITKQLKLDLAKYNSQYLPIQIREFKYSHDRFFIIDNKDVYHIGASLKDLGKKWFAFSKFDKEALKLLEKLE